MKRIFLLSFLLFTFCDVLSQTSNDKIIYLDSLFHFSTESNHSYKWIIKDYNNDEDIHEAVEYYKSGNIKTKGVTFSKNITTSFRWCKIDRMHLRGIIIEYYENGNKKSITNFSNPELEKIYNWYENGQKKSESEWITKIVNHSKSSPFLKEYGTSVTYDFRLLQFWNTAGIQKIIDGNGEYEEDNENEYSKGKYINGKKNGEWIGRDKKHNFSYTENYVDDKLILGTSIDSNQVKHKYTLITKYAKPTKGLKSFSKKYNQSFQDRISPMNSPEQYFILTINTNGKIIDFNTSNITNEKDKEKVIKLLSKYEKWTPKEIRGIKIKSTLHYNFS